jgi:uncharacterized protein
MANTIVWFDIPVIDLERALRFYSAVLGKTVKKEEFPGGAIGVFAHEDGDVGGCLYVSDTDRPSDHGPLLYFNCEGRLDEAIAAVEAHGGDIIKAKHSIVPHGSRAIVFDSEGNRIALHSS